MSTQDSRHVIAARWICAIVIGLCAGPALAQHNPLLPYQPLPPPTKNFPVVPVTAWDDSGIVELSAVNVTARTPGERAFSSNNVSVTADVKKNKNGCADYKSDPIVLSSGTKVDDVVDFELPGEMGLKFERYTQRALVTTNLDYSLDVTCNQSDGFCTHITLKRPDGSSIVFSGHPGSTTRTHPEQGGGGLATLVQNPDNTYTLHDEDASTQVYTQDGLIQQILDVSGIGLTFSYSYDQSGFLVSERVTHTSGQYITLTFQTLTSNGYVIGYKTTVTDPAGNAYVYVKDPSGYLTSVTLPGTPATVFSYLYSPTKFEVDINGAPYSYTTFDANLRANGTYLADGSQNTSIIYSTNATGLVAKLTNPLGHTTISQYNASQQLESVSADAVADCGSTINARVYDANGNLAGTTDNNGNNHTYTYAINGQLQTETEADGTSQARTTDYQWDSNLQLNRLSSVTVEGISKALYTYNPQNRLASVSVTNLSGNGISGQTLTTTYQYTLYANGMVHTLAVTHPSPNNSDTDVSTYDALGNLVSLVNGLGQTTTYSNYNGLGEFGRVVGRNGDTTDYSYDARGRVSTKTTYPNGTAATWTYTYDGFGLLYTQTAPGGLVTTWNRDAEMRVKTITENNKDGLSTESFGYDANGDVTSHTVTRGGVMTLSESAAYDGLGRVYQKQGAHGEMLTYGYDGNGNVISITNAAGHITSYQYDALDRVSQVSESGGASVKMPSIAPSLTVPASNTTGSYTVSWAALSGAASYTLRRQSNSGSWTIVQNGAATSWSASGQTNGAYGYQVRACNATGCGPWSLTGTTTVSIPSPPAAAPSITAPANSTTGAYTVNWSSVGNTSSYILQEQVNGGTWVSVQNSAAQSWSTTGRPSGSYGYRVEACNGAGCGVWSSTMTVSVSIPIPPSVAPGLTVPASNNNGSYTASWSSVGGATSYELQEQVNSGGWSDVQNTAATSWSATGKSNGSYGYQVRGCNFGGCGPWSTSATTVVTFPPASAPTLSAPGSSTGGSYTVSWSGVTGAANYTLQESVSSGSWTSVQASAALSWSTSGRANGNYRYQVEACNPGGCGPWSGISSVTVTSAPQAPASITAPSYVHGVQYYVTWAAAATATSYNVQRTNLDTATATVIASTAATSVTISAPTSTQTLQYAVQACNASGCSPYQNAPNTTATDPAGPIH